MPFTVDDSNFSYNGINLFITKTNSITQKAILSPDGCDYLYTEYLIDISAIYNPAATSYFGNNPPIFTPGLNPSATNLNVRHHLLQPRKDLSFQGIANPILRSPLIVNGIDANNGPQPLHCDIYHLSSDNTYHVRYIIKTWIIDCPNGDDSPIISNRWSQSIGIDFQHRTTRTTIGQAFFRTDILDFADEFVDIFRSQVIAAIPTKAGFIRESVRFTTVPQGNALQYEIIDTERFYNLGPSILDKTYVVKADGGFNQASFSDGKDGPEVGCSLLSMKIALWGNHNANNWTLAQLAMQIIDKQIVLSDIGPPVGNILRSYSVYQSATDHYVEYEISVQTVLKKGEVKPGLPAEIKYLQLIEPVNEQFDPADTGENPGLPNDRGSRGTDQVYLRSSLLKEACIPQNIPQPNQSSSTTGEQQPYGDNTQIEIFETNFLPDIPTNYNPNDQLPYIRATTTSQYQYNGGATIAPIANPNNPAGAVAGLANSNENSSNASGPYFSQVLNFVAPYTTLIVEWMVERAGVPPNPPHPTKQIQCLEQEQQWFLLSAIYKPYSTMLSLDGNYIFTMTGRYEYAAPASNDPSSPPMIVFDIPQNVQGFYGGAIIAGDTANNCGQGNLSGQYQHGIIDTAQDQDQGGGQDT